MSKSSWPYLILLFTAIILSLSLSACGGGGGGDAGNQSPEIEVVSVSDFGTLTTTSFITARDGGYSGLFAGLSVWLYGDTFLRWPDSNGETLLGNSWSWTTDRDAGDGIGGFNEDVDSVGAPISFLPLTVEEQAFNQTHAGDDCAEQPCRARWALWPGALVVDPDSQQALIFYEKIYAEPGEFNFYGVGTSIAIWPTFTAARERPVVQVQAQYPTLLFNQDEPGFGSAALVLGSTLYAYGCDLDFLEKPCYLARVKFVDVLDRQAWEFYAGGDSWSQYLHKAQAVFIGNDILSVSYNAHLERYLAVYSAPFGDAVMLRTAAQPEGPWSIPVAAFKPIAPSNQQWVYDAQAHVEYDQENGRVITISYSRGTGLFQSEVRLVAVELERLDR